MTPESSSDRNRLADTAIHHLADALRGLTQRSGKADVRLATLREIAYRLQTHVEELLVWDEDEGYLRTLFDADPRFAQEVVVLREEHHRLRTALNEIITRMNFTPSDERIKVDEECRFVEKLVQQLDACREQEDVLFYRALSIDLGGEGG